MLFLIFNLQVTLLRNMRNTVKMENKKHFIQENYFSGLVITSIYILNYLEQHLLYNLLNIITVKKYL